MEINHVGKLDAEIKRLQAEEGVVDLKLLRAGPMSSQDSVAKGLLDLMEAPVVVDNELF